MKWYYVGLNSSLLYPFFKKENESKDIKNIDVKKVKILEPSICLIEFDKIESKDLVFLTSLSKQLQNSTVFIFLNEIQANSIIYNFAYKTKAISILNVPKNRQEAQSLVENVLDLAKNEIRKDKLSKISNFLDKNIPFLYHKKEDNIYFNELFQKIFPSIITCPTPSISYFLKNKELSSGEKSFKGSVTQKDFETFISYSQTSKKEYGIKHRYEAIEWIRDRFEQEGDILNLHFFLFCIENKNYAQKSLLAYDFYKWRKSIFTLLLKTVPPFDFVAKWDEEHYLFCYTKKTPNGAKAVFEKLEELNESITPSLKSYFWKNQASSTKEAVELINGLSLDPQYMQKEEIYHIKVNSSQEALLSEGERIHQILKDAMISKQEIKLQNIYKGMCINTNSLVLGEEEGMLYLKSQSIQAYAMKESQSVVIISDIFEKDVQASVKLIDNEKGIVYIDDFCYLKHSTNERRHSRVQTKTRTPIFITQGKVQIHGEILDLSFHALAITTRIKIDSLKEDRIVNFSFHLPNERMDDGFSLVKGLGKIIFTEKLNKMESKIVLTIDLKKPYDSNLLQYIHSRQKELVKELKVLSSLASN